MKHTPGPLKIKKTEFGDDPDWAIVDTEGRIIGEAFYLVYFDTYRPAEANARLWASAPDLLAERDALRKALQRCIKALQVWRAHLEVNDPTLETPEVIEAIKQARAALGAAEEKIPFDRIEAAGRGYTLPEEAA